MLFMHMELFTYNRTFTLFLTICLCTVFMSCGEHHKVKRMISDFSASEIILPEELECIYKSRLDLSLRTLSNLTNILYITIHMTVHHVELPNLLITIHYIVLLT